MVILGSIPVGGFFIPARVPQMVGRRKRFIKWCNKGRGVCYPVCGMVYIKGPLLLIGKSSPGGSS